MVGLRLGIPFLFLVGCSNLIPTKWGAPGSLDDGDTDTGSADADTDSDTDSDSDTESGIIDSTPIDSGNDSGGFDEPGDHTGYDASEDVASVDLTDASGESNEGQEFYLIAVNRAEEEAAFTVRYLQADQVEDAEGPPAPNAKHGRRVPKAKPGDLVKGDFMRGPVATPPRRPILQDTDVGSRVDTFRVRTDMNSTDADDYAVKDAKLWALGTSVAIWVDNEVPIDWDFECDGLIDVPAEYDSFGFDNCDLDTIADIVDFNVIPNVRALYGDESDIDADGRVDVFITPEMNSITRTSEDEENYASVLPSYAEPAVDLTDYDLRSNPGSDEREVIYVFAPDPYGFYNVDAVTSISAYTGYQVLAEIARSFTTLVSYNQHVEVAEGSVEDDWLNDALGTFAADYCGFGAAFYEDAWDYLDAPYLNPLVAESSSGSLETLSHGPQYLFALWLWDYAEAQGAGGAVAFNAMVQNDQTGVDSVVAGMDGPEFDDLVVGWQTALLTTGVLGADGSALIEPSADFVPYTTATTISSIPADRDDHYGANGYQRGVNLRGDNTPASDGQTDAPTSLTSRAVRLGGPDPFIYNPAFSFSGYMLENYSAEIIRLTGIPYDEAVVQIQVQSGDVLGTIIRWNDPVPRDYAIENVFSPTDANSVELPLLPADGTAIHGVGDLTAVGSVDVVTSNDDDGSPADVPDTDRWLLDLTDRAPTEDVHLAIWLKRHFASSDGEVGPQDPWVAIAPLDIVPEPTVGGVERGSCTGGIDFAYPGTILEYLYYQIFLSSTMYSGSETAEASCGAQSLTATTCDDDWDRDGVLDADEPNPDTFYGQALVLQCTINGNVMPADIYDPDWLDADELDEDEDFSKDYVQNLGGRSGEDAEEGFIEPTVPGGVRYLIVVGASTGTGNYELVVRQVP